jgi:hypothetical protein
MGNPLQPAFDMYMGKLQKQVAEVTSTKKMLNELAKEMEIEIPFPDVQAEVVTGQLIRLDQFFNKAPSTAVTEYLEIRGQSKGAATWDEIWGALQRGGFKGEGSELDVKTTLKKNTTAFKYFAGNDAFGLKGWYGQEKKKDKVESAGNKTQSKKRGRPRKNASTQSESGVSDQSDAKPEENKNPK